ncbi:MAG: hypothetical protein ACKO3N_02020, partial [Verrucomicrobiota bacterium]
MTPTEQARLEGAILSLEARGRAIELTRTAEQVRALVKRADPASVEFEVGSGDRLAAQVFILRTEMPDEVRIGDGLRDLSGGVVYRIAEIEDSPHDVWVVCQ